MNWYSLIPMNRLTILGFLVLMLGFFLLPFIVGIFIIPIGGTMMLLGTSYSMFCLLPNHKKMEAEIRDSIKKNGHIYKNFFKSIWDNK